MRLYKFSEKRYTECLNGLASQLMAMAQEDAREAVREYPRGDSFVELTDDYATNYTSDACDQLNEAVHNKLRRKK